MLVNDYYFFGGFMKKLFFYSLFTLSFVIFQNSALSAASAASDDDTTEETATGTGDSSMNPEVLRIKQILDSGANVALNNIKKNLLLTQAEKDSLKKYRRTALNRWYGRVSKAKATGSIPLTGPLMPRGYRHPVAAAAAPIGQSLAPVHHQNMISFVCPNGTILLLPTTLLPAAPAAPSLPALAAPSSPEASTTFDSSPDQVATNTTEEETAKLLLDLRDWF